MLHDKYNKTELTPTIPYIIPILEVETFDRLIRHKMKHDIPTITNVLNQPLSIGTISEESLKFRAVLICKDSNTPSIINP